MTNSRHMTDDSISRQAAIDAIANCTNCGDEKTLRAYVAKHNLDNGWTGGILEAIDAIEDLPSAQPERKRGEWEEIEVIADAYDISGVKTWASKMKCDQCGFTTIAIEGRFSQYNFCPNCGADMRNEVTT